MIPLFTCQFAITAALYGFWGYNDDGLKREAGYEPRAESVLDSRAALDLTLCDAQPWSFDLQLVADGENPIHRAAGHWRWDRLAMQVGMLPPWQGSPELSSADLATHVLTPYTRLFRPFQSATATAGLAYGQPGQPALQLQWQVSTRGKLGLQWLNDVIKGEDPAANYNQSALQPATILRWQYQDELAPHELIFGSYDLNHSFYLSWGQGLQLDSLLLRLESLTDWRRQTIPEPRTNVVTISSVLGGSARYDWQALRATLGYYATRIEQPDEHGLQDAGANSPGIVFDDNADQWWLKLDYSQPWGQFSLTVVEESGRFQRAVPVADKPASVWKRELSAYLGVHLNLGWRHHPAEPGATHAAIAPFRGQATPVGDGQRLTKR